MTTNRKLAKGLWPVLLLSAALSLPAASGAAPSPKEHGKARAAEPWNQKQQNKAARAAAKQELRAQRQAVKAQRQAVKVQRQELRQNRAAKQIVIVPSRRAARAPVAVRPGRVVQAPVVVRPTRKVAPAPIIVQPSRQVYRAPVYSAPYVANRAIRTRPWYGWNNRSNYSRYGSGEFQLEGTFVGQQYGCALLQDNQGQVIPLLNNPGDLVRGDHLLVTGRIQNSSVCGTAFRIFNVDDVWNDRNDRYYQGDRYDDNRYDNRGNRDLISVNGVIDRGLYCTSIDADNGERYALSGDLGGFRDGDHARVIGFVGGRSLCGARTIDVQEIR
jgi:hypothetical protein